MTNGWLSSKKAAEQLGLNLRTVYRLVDHGELPAYKLGRVIRFKQTDLDAFVESTRIAPGTLAHLHAAGGE